MKQVESNKVFILPNLLELVNADARFVEWRSFLVFKWPKIIVMKCINTIKWGENCGNHQQIPIQCTRTWTICDELANHMQNRISAGEFHQSEHRGSRCKHTETLVKQSQKYPCFQFSVFSWKVQFTSTDTQTIVPLKATSFLGL